MVRTYKKKTKRGEWSKDAMKAAINKVLCKELSYQKAAATYSVPQTTLERYVKRTKQGCEITIGLPLGPIKTIFTQKEEDEIVEYLKYMEERLFGLTTIELRRLAYKLAQKNGKAHNFNAKKKMAGVDWLKSFVKRHQNVSIELGPKPGCSYIACHDIKSSFENVSPREILPIPIVHQTERRKKYQKGKKLVITSTPYIKEFRKSVKLENVSDGFDDSCPNRNIKSYQKPKFPDQIQNDIDDAICFYCNDVNHTILTSSEPLVCCLFCGQWAHSTCARIDKDNLEESYICLLCQDN